MELDYFHQKINNDQSINFEEQIPAYDISLRQEIDAKIIGNVVNSNEKKLTVKSKFGEFNY